MTSSNSSLPPDVLAVPLLGHLHDDDYDDGPEFSSISLTSSTSRRPARSPPLRSTAISYECGSLTYFAALLEEMNDDGDDEDDEENNHNVDNTEDNRRIPAHEGQVLQDIQGRLIEKHVRNGTIRPKTISIIRDDDRQDTNRASAPASSVTLSNARRGRRRLGSNPRSITHGEARSDNDAPITSRVVYTFRSGEGE